MTTTIKHNEWIDCKQTPRELAEELGNLRYNELSLFLRLLGAKLYNDAIRDKSNLKIKLSGRLSLAADYLIKSSIEIRNAWVICKPHMNDNANKGEDNNK